MTKLIYFHFKMVGVRIEALLAKQLRIVTYLKLRLVAVLYNVSWHVYMFLGKQ